MTHTENTKCAGCGEQWPCSTEQARGSYSANEHAKHGPSHPYTFSVMRVYEGTTQSHVVAQSRTWEAAREIAIHSNDPKLKALPEPHFYVTVADHREPGVPTYHEVRSVLRGAFLLDHELVGTRTQQARLRGAFSVEDVGFAVRVKITQGAHPIYLGTLRQAFPDARIWSPDSQCDSIHILPPIAKSPEDDACERWTRDHDTDPCGNCARCATEDVCPGCTIEQCGLTTTILPGVTATYCPNCCAVQV